VEKCTIEKLTKDYYILSLNISPPAGGDTRYAGTDKTVNGRRFNRTTSL
jgi:hypothetical protein